MEGVEFTPTEEGTPQGGVISPLLANVALHGLEAVAKAGQKKSKEQPMLIRYADDFVILYSDQTELQAVAARVSTWLEHKGLRLKPSKTRTTTTLNPN